MYYVSLFDVDGIIITFRIIVPLPRGPTTSGDLSLWYGRQEIRVVLGISLISR